MDFAGAFLGVLIACLVLAGLAALLRFCILDARRRGKSPLLVTLAGVLFFPWGLIAWLIFRPEPVRRRTQHFDLKDFRAQ